MKDRESTDNRSIYQRFPANINRPFSGAYSTYLARSLFLAFFSQCVRMHIEQFPCSMVCRRKNSDRPQQNSLQDPRCMHRAHNVGVNVAGRLAASDAAQRRLKTKRPTLKAAPRLRKYIFIDNGGKYPYFKNMM